MKARYLWSGLLAVALVLYAGYRLMTRPWPVAPLTKKEQQMTDTLFKQTKPQCLGRYLFEVPVTWTNTLTNQIWVNKAQIDSKRLYRPAFEQRIRLREQELKNSHTVDEEDQPFLKQVYRINENTVIFDRNENESVPGFGRILEGHLYDNGVAFIVTAEIMDLSDPRYQQDKEEFLNSGTKESDLNDKAQKLAEMQSLLSRLKGRADDEVPAGPGSCIPQGFIGDTTARATEKMSIVYSHDEFDLVVESNNFLKADSTLLERADEINAEVLRTGAHTFKKGPVKLADIAAEEWLIKAKQNIYRPEDKNNIPYYVFNLYGNEKTADYTHPRLSVTFGNSGVEMKSYTDAQLVDIWDRITRTFRYRPGAF